MYTLNEDFSSHWSSPGEIQHQKMVLFVPQEENMCSFCQHSYIENEAINYRRCKLIIMQKLCTCLPDLQSESACYMWPLTNWWKINWEALVQVYTKCWEYMLQIGAKHPFLIDNERPFCWCLYKIVDLNRADGKTLKIILFLNKGLSTFIGKIFHRHH